MNLEQAIEFARKRKEARVAVAPDDHDLRPLLVFSRGGQTVAIVTTPDVDKEQGLAAARIGLGGYSADEVILILDAHMKLMQLGEEPPAPGELQRMCDQEGACELGLITDLVVVNRITHEGVQEMACVPYAYHGSGTVFRWSGEIRTALGREVKGYIPESLFCAVLDSRSVNVVAALVHAIGLSPGRARLEADEGTTEALRRLGCRVESFTGMIEVVSSFLESPTCNPAEKSKRVDWVTRKVLLRVIERM